MIPDFDRIATEEAALGRAARITPAIRETT